MSANPIPQPSGPTSPSSMPVQKVVAGAIAGALVTIIIFFLDNYVLKGPKITGEVAAAMTTVLTFIVSYIIPPAGLTGNK